MNNSVIDKLAAYVQSLDTAPTFNCATESAIEQAERDLGFSIPPLLRACYLQIANGGFGPGYGLVGVAGGYKSDYGDLVETFRVAKEGAEYNGGEWRTGLLPFCEFGCNIFSCVDCNDEKNAVWTSEECEVWPQTYDLSKFFDLWIEGVDVLGYDSVEKETREIINPFTGKKAIISRRKRR